MRRERELTRDHLFVFTLLQEPTKAELDAWRPGDPIDRAARITVWDRAEGMLIESIVAVSSTVNMSFGNQGLVVPPVIAAFWISNHWPVDVFVRKLRQKLKTHVPDVDYVITHYGVGYRFEPSRGVSLD